jgi:hypothetical protein
MAINILKNMLDNPRQPLPYILFQTGNHQVKIYYNGDYTADKAAHAIKQELIVVHVKTTKTLIDLKSSGPDTWLDISMYSLPIRNEKDINILCDALQESIGSVEDVNTVYQTYFGQYMAPT